MGRGAVLVLVATALLAALAGWALYEPFPDFLDQYWKTQWLFAGFKATIFYHMLWLPLGVESKLNLSRQAFHSFVASKEFLQDRGQDLEVSDVSMAGVAVRVYRPKGAKGRLPALVYFHGGGWVLLDVDAYDDVVANQALAGNLVAVSVEYRLAPEHPFPAGLDDCVSVTRHVLRHGDKYGIDTKRVAIGGDSAGGNLAAAVAIQLRDEKVSPPLKAQVLIYGVFTFCSFHSPVYEARRQVDRQDPSDAMGDFLGLWQALTPSQLAAVKAQNFTPEFQAKCEKYNSVDLLPQHFVQPGFRKFQYPRCDVTNDVKFVSERLMDPRVSPSLADNLKGLPPAFVLSCQWDLIRDDSAFYAKRLEQAGVKVEWLHLPDSFHGIFNMFYGSKQFRNGVKAHQAVTAFLKKTL